jgi:subtilisin-like proprotein convertase family protein
MNPRTHIQGIVGLLVVAVVPCFNALAGPIYTYSGDFHLRIPGASGASRGWMEDAVIEIPDHFTIYDLDVGVTLSHTKVFDLQLFLESPAGTRLCLNMYNPFDEYFEGEDYIDTVFDDEADTPIEGADAPFTGRFRPRLPAQLSAFDGQDTCGVWRLQIYDAFYADTGYLQNFQLIVTVPDPPAVKICGAINVGATNATLCGRVIEDDGEACQYRFRYWNVDEEVGSVTAWTGSVTSGECFSQEASDLSPGCQYYFFADIRNSKGEYSSIGESFTTMTDLVELGCPNGSVTLLVGSTFPIWWRADRIVTDVLIEYSMDNGVSWTTIATVANTLDECACPCQDGGSCKWYYWTVPSVNSQQCLVRVSDKADPNSFDISENTFTIVMQTVPDVVGMAQSDAEAAITVAGLVVGATTLAYDAVVPAGNVRSQDPVAGTPIVVGSIVDLVISAGPLAAGPPKVSLKAVCNIGKSVATLEGVIDNDGGGSCQYRFFYWTPKDGSGGVTDWSFDFKHTGESFSVDVTGLTPSYTYYFFAWAKNSAGQGSNVGWSFTTLTNLLELVTPKAGHKMIAGSKRVIWWKADTIVSEVLIEYSTDNGSSWNSIDTVVNTPLYGGYLGGWYVWDVPAENSNQCLMRISDTSDPSIFDMTDGTFSIAP